MVDRPERIKAIHGGPRSMTRLGGAGTCSVPMLSIKVGRRKEMRKLWALDHGDHAVSCLMYTSCQPANPTLYSGIWIERPLRTTAFLLMRTKRPAVHHYCRCEVKQVHRGEASRCETNRVAPAFVEHRASP